MSKKKSIILHLHCPCGKSWTAAYPNGLVKKTAKCPACLNYVSTATSNPILKPTVCFGCKRPLLNSHHCTYCGRPVSEKEAQRQIAAIAE